MVVMTKVKRVVMAKVKWAVTTMTMVMVAFGLISGNLNTIKCLRTMPMTKMLLVSVARVAV